MEKTIRTFLGIKSLIFLLILLFSAGFVLAADKKADKVYDRCDNLPSFTNLDCKNSDAVYAALNELHSCMKSRFSFNGVVREEAWPSVEVPESGIIIGGYGDWAVACLRAWPCKDKRLAFIKKIAEKPHLAFISERFVVDFDLDKVYDSEKLSKYKILKISGLEPDEPWFKVDE